MIAHIAAKRGDLNFTTSLPQYVHRPRRHERHGDQGDERLHHHQQLGQCGEGQRVGGAEGRRVGEGDIEVVDEAGPPLLGHV